MQEFVIIALMQGTWYYFSPNVGEDDWDTDLYLAKKFKSYDEAKEELISGFKRNWGGFFEIKQVFVNR